MQHFFPSFIYLLSLSLSLSPTNPPHERKSTLLSRFSLCFCCCLLCYRCGATHTQPHVRTLSLSPATVKNFRFREIFFFKRCSLAHTDGVLVCLLICLLVCSHKSAAAGALQRNFLPFIAQHIFFGIFFSFLLCFSVPFRRIGHFLHTGLICTESVPNGARTVPEELDLLTNFDGLKLLTDFDLNRTFGFLWG